MTLDWTLRVYRVYYSFQLNANILQRNFPKFKVYQKLITKSVPDLSRVTFKFDRRPKSLCQLRFKAFVTREICPLTFAILEIVGRTFTLNKERSTR